MAKSRSPENRRNLGYFIPKKTLATQRLFLANNGLSIFHYAGGNTRFGV
jgi:hypothetical protein